jgi:exopolysaccharide biosynthesis polyprenyl glycosylphosphotransferase
VRIVTPAADSTDSTTAGSRLQFGPLARQRIVREALCAFDLIAIASALALCSAFAPRDAMPLAPLGLFGWALLLATWHAGFRGLGLYRGYTIPLRIEWSRCIAASVIAVGSYWLASGIVGRIDFETAGSALALSVPVAAFALGRTRILFAQLLGRALRNPRRLQRVLIVGTGKAALTFAAELQKVPELGFEIVGFVDDDWAGIDAFHRAGHRLVSDLKNVSDFLRDEIVDDLVIAAPLSVLMDNVGGLLVSCQSLGIHVRVLGCALDHLHTALPELQSEAGIMLSATATVGDQWRLVVKRGLDILGSALLLTLLAPVFVVTAAVVAYSSPGPVFFVQERLGLRRRRFAMLKFRTMREGADREIDALEEQNQVDGAVFKIGDDPRLTRPGRWLRRFSIDELPQLWNVFRGDMSLVGPRPLPVRDYLRFEELAHLRRFSVRPGLTGLWQISGRSTLSFERWMELDLRYIDNWSLALDAEILAKTPRAVVSGRGAY